MADKEKNTLTDDDLADPLHEDAGAKKASKDPIAPENPYGPKRKKKRDFGPKDDLASASPAAEEAADEEEDEEDEDNNGELDESDELDEPYDPTWWAPHAVLGGLLLIGLVGFFGGFRKQGGPGGEEKTALAKDVPATAAASARPAGSAMRPPMRPQAPPGDQIGAQHLLVMYKGSQRAPATITRSKDEAKKRAEEALAKVKSGKDFTDIAKEYSDEPGAAQRGGDLGMFGHGQMVPAFDTAAFALKVGEISGLVETPFGYHVIKRTK